MKPQALQVVQRTLITSLTVVLALVVGAAFVRIVRPADPDAVDNRDLAAGTTTVADDTTTTSSDTTTPGDGSGTTTTVDAPQSCAEPAPGGGEGTVLQIYYTCGRPESPNAGSYVFRTVPQTQQVLTGTLTEMVKGPDDDEREMGFRSVFSEATEGALAGVSLSAGRATVDLTGLGDIEGISSTGTSRFLLATLNANVFQFSTVDSVEYRLGGSCDAFWELIGDPCRPISRSDAQEMLAEWREEG